MSFAALLTQTVTIIEPGTSTDTYGNEVADWGAGATTTTGPGLIQQTDATEVTVDRDTVVSNLMLFLPPDRTITALCRATEGERTFEVIGEPDLLRTPRGPHHVEARLRHVAG